MSRYDDRTAADLRLEVAEYVGNGEPGDLLDWLTRRAAVRNGGGRRER